MKLLFGILLVLYRYVTPYDDQLFIVYLEGSKSITMSTLSTNLSLVNKLKRLDIGMNVIHLTSLVLAFFSFTFNFI